MNTRPGTILKAERVLTRVGNGEYFHKVCSEEHFGTFSRAILNEVTDMPGTLREKAVRLCELRQQRNTDNIKAHAESTSELKATASEPKQLDLFAEDGATFMEHFIPFLDALTRYLNTR